MTKCQKVTWGLSREELGISGQDSAPQSDAEGVWMPQMEHGGDPKAFRAPVEARTQDRISGLISLWPEGVLDKISRVRKHCCAVPCPGNSGRSIHRVPREQGCLEQLGVPVIVRFLSAFLRAGPTGG